MRISPDNSRPHLELDSHKDVTHIHNLKIPVKQLSEGPSNNNKNANKNNSNSSNSSSNNSSSSMVVALNFLGRNQKSTTVFESICRIALEVFQKEIFVNFPWKETVFFHSFRSSSLSCEFPEVFPSLNSWLYKQLENWSKDYRSNCLKWGNVMIITEAVLHSCSKNICSERFE